MSTYIGKAILPFRFPLISCARGLSSFEEAYLCDQEYPSIHVMLDVEFMVTILLQKQKARTAMQYGRDRGHGSTLVTRLKKKTFLEDT
jgi:hypothetical protein